MAQRFYEEINHWYIYAVVSREDKLAYVAKSCAKNPIARYYEHTRGEIKWTKDDFGPDGDSMDSEFLILESLDCTAPVAYRHIVAWCHYFEEQRFVLLNSPKKGYQCDYFKPETQKIYDTVCAPVSLSELFEREVIYERMESETKVIIPDKLKSKSKMTQLNIRVHRNVAESFRKFCKQSHLSQNNALALLLAPENRARLESVHAPWEELQYQKELNKQLKIQNEQLHKMEIETRRRERNYRKIIAAISNETINAIGRSGCKGFAERPVLCPMRFKDAKRQHDFEDYRYPDKSGVEIITLVGIVQGIRKMIPNKDVLLPAALFVLGENNAGDKVKFRWYPREDNVGISPRNKLYAYSGARWLTGFAVAPDGAVDLIAAIPVELLEEDRASKEQSFTNIDREQIDSLEEKIRDAKERTQGTAPHE